MSTEDITGKRFERLVVIEFAEKRQGRTYWKCQCDCGNTTISAQQQLGTRTKSCGCYRRDMMRERQTQHGHAKDRKLSKEYHTWTSITQRCYNPKDRNYHNYGGRGITMCDRWRSSFENFYTDMGPAPKNMSIERKDNNGNYEPSNCKWATVKEQGLNRRTTKMLTYNGETKMMKDWAEIVGINYGTLTGRMLRGWTVEEAFSGKRISS
jgi:hypothetical protein